MRRFISFGFCMLAVFLPWNAVALADDILATDTYTQEVPLGLNGSISVTNGDGAVVISTWDRPEVRVEAVKEIHTYRTWRSLFHIGRPSEETLQALLDDTRVEMRKTGSTLTVATRYPDSPNGIVVHYTITVPAAASIDLHVSNGRIEVAGVAGPVRVDTANGRIDVTDVAGPVLAKSRNGRIACRNIAGSVDVHTSNGRVECVDCSGAIKAGSANGRIEVVSNAPTLSAGGIECATSNGRIDVTLPKGASFTVDAHTSLGSVDVGFPAAEASKQGKTLWRGDVNGGGPPVRLATSLGSIHLNAGS